ncbi:Protein PRY1 [Metarhizium brunneum]|uniref:Protein PRY1 n=1 Tax=Metarhizium brunneum TaxID=500148 RepID=A0A7D5Z8R8_9HYPO
MRLSSISILTLATAGMATAAPAELEQRPRGNFKDEMLAAHNFFRGQHGAEPLSWKGNLASKAQDWADTCRWSHDSAGENLAAGTGLASWGSFVNLWGAERTKYNWADPGFSPDTGHFTQVVWKATQSLGCGWNTCRGGKGKASGVYVVCKYAPVGNYVGQFADNVGEQTEGEASDVWHK